ncbi:hypothetical protein [Kosmotoga sp. DU53]|uniref:hypothetical protein n=1 Tax=Kosmotoga sp. DU53 TaxID=1310160 RepID=UPI0007C4AB36|nr:hypothetical protein [Kosmotoga sp. DU53]OAA19510.1 hypothetical protein DU53_10710 [Kosmotoga sp. DU53]
MKHIGIAKETIFKAVEKLLENRYPSDGTKVSAGNIELWDHILEVKNDKELAKIFNDKLIAAGDNIETLLANPNFYSCCAKHKIVLDNKLHRYIFNGISSHFRDLDEDSINDLRVFFSNQNKTFLKRVIKDFKKYVEDKSYETQELREPRVEIDLILDIFTPIFEIVFSEHSDLKNELKDSDFIESLKDVSINGISESIGTFFKLLDVNIEE